MSDYISREELLERVKPHTAENEFFDYVDVEDIKSMPSADVRENIHGEWIRITHGIEVFHKCSVCGEESDYVLPTLTFCPNCGADMRGDT